jgi:hypothetical protein
VLNAPGLRTVPPAGTRAGTPQRGIPTMVRVFVRPSARMPENPVDNPRSPPYFPPSFLAYWPWAGTNKQ